MVAALQRERRGPRPGQRRLPLRLPPHAPAPLSTSSSCLLLPMRLPAHPAVPYLRLPGVNNPSRATSSAEELLWNPPCKDRPLARRRDLSEGGPTRTRAGGAHSTYPLLSQEPLRAARRRRTRAAARRSRRCRCRCRSSSRPRGRACPPGWPRRRAAAATRRRRGGPSRSRTIQLDRSRDSRGDAAAASSIVRGAVAATPLPRAGSSAKQSRLRGGRELDRPRGSRGDAVAASWIVRGARGGVTATRPREDGSRRRRERDDGASIDRRGVDAARGVSARRFAFAICSSVKSIFGASSSPAKRTTAPRGASSAAAVRASAAAPPAPVGAATTRARPPAGARSASVPASRRKGIRDDADGIVGGWLGAHAQTGKATYKSKSSPIREAVDPNPDKRWSPVAQRYPGHNSRAPPIV